MVSNFGKDILVSKHYIFLHTGKKLFVQIVNYLIGNLRSLLSGNSSSSHFPQLSKFLPAIFEHVKGISLPQNPGKNNLLPKR